MKTLVMGASLNPARYAYMAMRMLKEYDHEVVGIGRREEKNETMEVVKGQPMLSDIDTITLYLNAANQKQYYDYFLALKPRRVIFNPGAENQELMNLLGQNGIETENACTLVLLRTNLY